MDDQLNNMNAILQDMQQTLKCNICLDMLNNPLTTKCGHSFCGDCLQQLVRRPRGVAQCPLCMGPITRRSLSRNPKVTSLVMGVRKVIASIKKDCCFEVTPSKYRPRPRPEVAADDDDSENEEKDEPRRGTRKRGATTLYNPEVVPPRPRPRPAKRRILAANGAQELSLHSEGATMAPEAGGASAGQDGGVTLVDAIARDHTYSSPTKQAPLERPSTAPKPRNRSRGGAGQVATYPGPKKLDELTGDVLVSASQEGRVIFPGEDVGAGAGTGAGQPLPGLTRERPEEKVAKWLDRSREIGFRIGAPHSSTPGSSTAPSGTPVSSGYPGASTSTSPAPEGSTPASTTSANTASTTKKFFKSKEPAPPPAPTQATMGDSQDTYTFIPSQKTPPRHPIGKRRGRGRGQTQTRGTGKLGLGRGRVSMGLGRVRGRGDGAGLGRVRGGLRGTPRPLTSPALKHSSTPMGRPGSRPPLELSVIAPPRESLIVRGHDDDDYDTTQPDPEEDSAGQEDDPGREDLPDSCPVTTLDHFDQLVAEVKEVAPIRPAPAPIRKEKEEEEEAGLLFVTPAQGTEEEEEEEEDEEEEEEEDRGERGHNQQPPPPPEEPQSLPKPPQLQPPVNNSANENKNNDSSSRGRRSLKQEQEAMTSLLDGVDDHQLSFTTPQEEEQVRKSRQEQREAAMRRDLSILAQTHDNTMHNASTAAPSPPPAMAPPPAPPGRRRVRFDANSSQSGGLGMRPTKRANTRYASELKHQLVETGRPTPAPVSLKSARSAKSPGWSHVAGARKDLTLRNVSLNITGGDIRPTGDVSRGGGLAGALPSSVDTNLSIEDTQQQQQQEECDVEHLPLSQAKCDRLQRLKDIVTSMNQPPNPPPAAMSLRRRSHSPTEEAHDLTTTTHSDTSTHSNISLTDTATDTLPTKGFKKLRLSLTRLIPQVEKMAQEKPYIVKDAVRESLSLSPRVKPQGRVVRERDREEEEALANPGRRTPQPQGREASEGERERNVLGRGVSEREEREEERNVRRENVEERNTVRERDEEERNEMDEEEEKGMKKRNEETNNCKSKSVISLYKDTEAFLVHSNDTAGHREQVQPAEPSPQPQKSTPQQRGARDPSPQHERKQEQAPQQTTHTTAKRKAREASPQQDEQQEDALTQHTQPGKRSRHGDTAERLEDSDTARGQRKTFSFTTDTEDLNTLINDSSDTQRSTPQQQQAKTRVLSAARMSHSDSDTQRSVPQLRHAKTKVLSASRISLSDTDTQRSLAQQKQTETRVLSGMDTQRSLAQQKQTEARVLSDSDTQRSLTQQNRKALSLSQTSDLTALSKPRPPHHTISPSLPTPPSATPGQDMTSVTSGGSPREESVTSDIKSLTEGKSDLIADVAKDSVTSGSGHGSGQVAEGSLVVPFKAVGPLCTKGCEEAGARGGQVVARDITKDLCLHTVPCEVYQVILKYLHVLTSQPNQHRDCCGGGTQHPPQQPPQTTTEASTSPQPQHSQTSPGGGRRELSPTQPWSSQPQNPQQLPDTQPLSQDTQPWSSQPEEEGVSSSQTSVPLFDLEVIRDSYQSQGLTTALPLPGVSVGKGDMCADLTLTPDQEEEEEEASRKVRDVLQEREACQDTQEESEDITILSQAARERLNRLTTTTTESQGSQEESISLLANLESVPGGKSDYGHHQHQQAESRAGDKLERRSLGSQRGREKVGIVPAIEKENVQSLAGSPPAPAPAPAVTLRRKPQKGGRPVLEDILTQRGDSLGPPSTESTQKAPPRSTKRPYASDPGRGRAQRGETGTGAGTDTHSPGRPARTRLSTRRRFVRINRPPSSDSDSDDAPTQAPPRTQAPALTQKPRQASPAPSSPSLTQHQLDSEEMRDLERLDRNVWEEFGRPDDLDPTPDPSLPDLTLPAAPPSPPSATSHSALSTATLSASTRKVVERTDRILTNMEDFLGPDASPAPPCSPGVVQETDDEKEEEEEEEKKEEEGEGITAKRRRRKTEEEEEEETEEETLSHGSTQSEGISTQKQEEMKDEIEALRKKKEEVMAALGDRKKKEEEEEKNQKKKKEEEEEEKKEEEEEESMAIITGTQEDRNSLALTCPYVSEMVEDNDLFPSNPGGGGGEVAPSSTPQQPPPPPSLSPPPPLPSLTPPRPQSLPSQSQPQEEEEEEKEEALPVVEQRRIPRAQLASSLNTGHGVGRGGTNPTRKNAPCIIFSGLGLAERRRIHESLAVMQRLGLEVRGAWGPEVTHVVVQAKRKVAPRTLKYLYGVAAGCWVLSQAWVMDSIARGKLMPEEPYEVLDEAGDDGPRRSRAATTHLLGGCCLWLVPPFEDMTLDQVKELAEMSGAQVVSSPAALAQGRRGNTNTLALIMLDSEQEAEGKELMDRHGLVAVGHNWLVDSITAHRLASFPEHLLGTPTPGTLQASGIPLALMMDSQEV